MAFVNEEVSDEDAKKYDFEALSQKLHLPVWRLMERWTIDRERNVFLLWLGADREEFDVQNRFLLWLEGYAINLVINGKDTGNYAQAVTTTWYSPVIYLPEVLESRRAEIVNTLKEALTVFRYSGYAGQTVPHTAVFNF